MATTSATAPTARAAWAGLDLGRYPFTAVLAAVTCALAPAYTLRWHLGFYPSTVLEDSIVLTVASFAYESWRLRVMPSFRSPLTIPAIIFLVAGAIDVVVAPDRRAALGIYRAYLIEPIAFFLVLATVVRTRRLALMVVAGLAVAGVVVGVPNSLVVLDAIRHHRLDVTVTAPVVIYLNANAVALFLVPLIAVAGSVALHASDRRERLLSVAFLVIAIASTLLSFSRGGYVALAAVAIGLALSHRRRWWLLGAAATVAVLLLLIPPINHRVGVELDFNSPHNTFLGRVQLWQAGLQMLSHHILFGAGLSGFVAAVSPYWNVVHRDQFIYPHNIVLNFWTETGLLGLAAFTWIMVAAFVMTWRGWRSGTEWRAIELGVFLALLAVVVHGLVDVPYFKNDLSLEFWALLGVAWAGWRWGNDSHHAELSDRVAGELVRQSG